MIPVRGGEGVQFTDEPEAGESETSRHRSPRDIARAAVVNASNPSWWLAQVADWWNERSRLPSVIVGNGITILGTVAGMFLFHMPALVAFISGYVISDAPFVWTIAQSVRRWDPTRYLAPSAWWVRERSLDWSTHFRDGMPLHGVSRATPAEAMEAGKFGFVDPKSLYKVGDKVCIDAEAEVTHKGWHLSRYRIEKNQSGLNVIARSGFRRVAVVSIRQGAPLGVRKGIAVSDVSSSTPLVARVKPSLSSSNWWAKQVGDWFNERSRAPSQVVGNGVTLMTAGVGLVVAGLSPEVAVVSGWVVGNVPTAWSAVSALKLGLLRYSSPAGYWEKQRLEKARQVQSPEPVSPFAIPEGRSFLRRHLRPGAPEPTGLVRQL